jgi:EAL domain-containing protein (putative c-di-GMP-specific phosphodiesterase class I)/GGDEF domain-containing protein
MKKNIERRSSIRHPIHHEATLYIEESHTVTCIIADYCAEGMFLKIESDDHHLLDDLEQHYENRVLKLTFHNEHQRTFDIQVKLVHVMHGALGVQFVERYPKAIQSLITMSEKGRVVPAREVDHIITECISFTQGFTLPLTATLWPKLVEDIQSNSVRCASDQDANAMMAAAERVEAKTSSLQDLFLSGIQDPLDSFQKSIQTSEMMNDRLSLIDKGEFEDWLTSRVLITKAETHYRNELLPLKVRLDAIGIGDKKFHQCAFGPALLVSSFQTVIASLSLGSAVEKLIFREFDVKILMALEKLYVGLNQILINHNVLKDLDLSKVVKSKTAPLNKKTPKKTTAVDVAHSPEEAGRSSSGGPQYSPLGASQPSQNNMALTAPPFQAASAETSNVRGAITNVGASDFQQNQQDAQAALKNVVGLMRSLRAKSDAEQVSPSEGGQPSPEVDKYSEDELTEGLSALQALSTSVDLENPVSLMDRVQENLVQGTDDEKEIDENQKVAIDVVDRFFFSMRNNPRLSSEAKQHLLKLEVPVLKVLLKDERFFEDHNSSVRAVMNRIAQLGAKGSKLNPSSRKKVSELVHKIVDQFEEDTQIFDSVLSELDQLIDRQNQHYVKNVERVAATADGVFKVEEAKVAVAQALNSRLDDRSIPSAVVALIDNGWKELLNLTYLKQGENSEDWHAYLAVIDRLIAYSDDPRIPLDMKALLPLIQKGLKLVSGPDDTSMVVRGALKDLIQNAPTGAHVMTTAQLHEVPETENDIVRRNLHKSQALKPWILRVKSIELGAWVQLFRKDAEPQYMRLVWIAKGYSKFVFVNHQGMKVIELGLFKFASYLKDQRIAFEFDYEVPMVNQGLDDMVKDVYDKLAYESSHDEGSGLVKRSEFCRQVRAAMKSGRRTSECHLLYIRFRSQVDDAIGVLSADFTKQVASSLAKLVDECSVIGRIDDTDFVLFATGNDLSTLSDRCFEHLLALCRQAPFTSENIVVRIGESRAHLGFNNPESMIQHASEPLSVDLELQSTTDQKNKNEQPFESQETLPEKNTASDVDESAPEPTFIDELDSSVEKEVRFEDLKLEIFSQRAAFLVKPLKGEKNNRKDKVNDAVDHINLQCFLAEASHPYEPENEALSRELDRWWVTQLVRLEQERHPVWDGVAYVRVKLSGHAFQNEDFTNDLLSLCDQQKLTGSKVCFDLYDCSEINDIHVAVGLMKQLGGKGFHFCLDHFGSERSPFSFLKALPFEMIKIDEGFMTALNQEESDDVAADSIIEIAHYLGKKVLATSVDNAICMQKMQHLKVDFVQGSTVSAIERL